LTRRKRNSLVTNTRKRKGGEEMTLTITFEKQVAIGGGLRMLVFKLVQSGASGGDLAVGNWLNHIDQVVVTNLSGTWVSAAWTDGSETITIGNEGSDEDVMKVTVIGK